MNDKELSELITDSLNQLWRFGAIKFPWLVGMTAFDGDGRRVLIGYCGLEDDGAFDGARVWVSGPYLDNDEGYGDLYAEYAAEADLRVDIDNPLLPGALAVLLREAQESKPRVRHSQLEGQLRDLTDTLRKIGGSRD